MRQCFDNRQLCASQSSETCLYSRSQDLFCSLSYFSSNQEKARVCFDSKLLCQHYYDGDCYESEEKSDGDEKFCVSEYSTYFDGFDDQRCVDNSYGQPALAKQDSRLCDSFCGHKCESTFPQGFCCVKINKTNNSAERRENEIFIIAGSIFIALAIIIACAVFMRFSRYRKQKAARHSVNAVVQLQQASHGSQPQLAQQTQLSQLQQTLPTISVISDDVQLNDYRSRLSMSSTMERLFENSDDIQNVKGVQWSIEELKEV